MYKTVLHYNNTRTLYGKHLMSPYYAHTKFYASRYQVVNGSFNLCRSILYGI